MHIMSIGIPFPKIRGFSDTLPLFKLHFPGRKSYKQSSLVTDLLQSRYDEHNAVEDVNLLVQLLLLIPNFENSLNIFSFSEVQYTITCSQNEKLFKDSYLILVEKKY